MNLEQIVKKMSESQWSLTNSKRFLAKRWHCSEEDIAKAKEIVRKKIENGELYKQVLDYRHKRSVVQKPNKAPFLKVLIFDIETAPMKAYVWHRWKEIVSLDQTISEWFTICWSAKWLYADEVISDCLTPEEILKEDDHRIVENLWKLFDEADIVVAHNGCVEKDTPILMKDFTWRKACELKEGDEIIAFEEGLPPGKPLRDENGQWQNPLGGKARQLKLATVTHNDVVKTPCVKVKFTNGYELITTLDHPWLMKTPKDNFLKWRNSMDLKPGDRVIRICKPWEIDKSYAGDWMSGFISGEGSLLETDGTPSRIQWCQRPTIVKDTADKYADELEIQRFDYLPKNNWGLGRGDCIYTNTLGGKWETFRLLGSLQLDRLKTHVNYEHLGVLFGMNTQGNDQETMYVQSVEYCGEHEVARLSTSTSTYIADGFAMHNTHFDVPKMNSRFLVNGLMPPSSYYTVDTLAIAKKTFGFSSNKLDALAGYFDIPHKMDTNFELWKDCLEGNQQALDYMEQYNKRDVEILESVYLKLRPFIKGHPNISNLTEKDCCCSCGSEAVEPIPNKFYYTSVSKFQLYRCKDCGAVVRGRKNLADKVKFVSPCR